YEEDLSGCWRTYEHDGLEVAFTDIAQIRTDTDGQRWYEFWKLNGSKMWITNARFAHCFALYANTEPEGVTGFMVDRHAEGLVVGSDEEKLGQRGSPTNELALTSVRVPRECIIGFRGRGQVNALETLNTGRTGLAVTTRATIQEMMEDAVDYLGGGTEADKVLGGIYPAQLTPPKALQFYWVGRLMEELVTTAAVANELIGLSDHPLTKDIRMESAIGKYFCSEAEHEGIDWMERLRGLDGLTYRHRIEKTRRDARVLNIYEGTNEVQRYLLLRSLVQQVLPAWRVAGEDSLSSKNLGDAHPELKRQLKKAKCGLMLRLDEAVNAFGDLIWANVNLQPCFFRLAEIAGLIKVMDAVLYRLEWLASHDVPEEYGARLEKASVLAFERCAIRIEALDRRFTASYAYLQDGRFPPDIQLGFLSLDPAGAVAESWGALPDSLRPAVLQEALPRDVRIVVLAKPVPVAAPRPRFGSNTFEESLYTIDAVDRRSLKIALKLKSRDPDKVRVEVISLAGESVGSEALQRALALGADEVTLLQPPGDVVLHDPTAVAHLVARVLTENPADIVFAGACASDTGQGIVAPMLAGMLGRDHVDSALTADWG
ncbi:MAG: acyl-CoA dehydrogenase family protein, partial [Acidimicrobiales bacterium]|nr:acyl-CoA dehydrogenase family protein [Acidimicrobiales bacterium]